MASEPEAKINRTQAMTLVPMAVSAPEVVNRFQLTADIKNWARLDETAIDVYASTSIITQEDHLPEEILVTLSQYTDGTYTFARLSAGDKMFYRARVLDTSLSTVKRILS